VCGIAGIFNRATEQPSTLAQVERMVSKVRHRGPEAAGLYIDDQVGFGHARLSIIDLSGGLQPLANEDKSLWLICNGEIFNYVELRPELESRGHRFMTGSDCETILHLYEDLGPECVHKLNGQFAFALWDRNRRRLMLARDRLGIRPLFYTTNAAGSLTFGSEIKALLTDDLVSRELDEVALGQVFTTWSPVPPRTMFKGIHSLRPGHMLLADSTRIDVRQYWRLQFPAAGAESPLSEPEAAEQLRALLLDATRIRLRADVPVGAYVSGGLDSSVVTALAHRYTTNKLQTFSVAFTDGEYDERPHQEAVATLLGTEHHTIECQPADIANVFPELIWHTETPLLRTAPAPLYLLARLVRQHEFKVVLTGEGSDEFLLGYDIFKETRVRAFWARRPESALRPRLLRKLYAHIPELSKPSQPYLEAFFGIGLDASDAPDFSHAVRWTNTARLHRYFSPELQSALAKAGSDGLGSLLAEHGADWDVLAHAQFNEATTFLDPYLLSSQGDRIAMAHAVEGRFPFLDYRVVEFANGLPARMKLRGLQEKALLKQAVSDLLPVAILERPKQPFRAPIRAAFVHPGAPDYVSELLDPKSIAADGVFKPQAVAWLLDRARNHARLSEIENMALVGIISFGLFKRAFWDDFASHRDVAGSPPVVIADFRSAQNHRTPARTLRGAS
jgi:asparagine synthase (glutamine-hydrolysing)